MSTQGEFKQMANPLKYDAKAELKKLILQELARLGAK